MAYYFLTLVMVGIVLAILIVQEVVVKAIADVLIHLINLLKSLTV